MEGPTPVSSLLHSATLVMAGIFSFARMHVQAAIALIGLSLASFCLVLSFSRYDKDAKRIVAASTVVMVSFL